MQHKLIKRIIISIALGVLIYVALMIWADFNNLVDTFKKINLLYLPLILFLVYLNYIIRFFKWDYYLKLLKINISKYDSFNIFFSGLSMALTPGKMGELLKCYILKKIYKVSVSFSAPVIIAERITDFISLIIIAILGAYTIGYGRVVVVSMGLSFLAVILVISSRSFSRKIISFLEKISIFSKYGKKIHTAYESIYILVKFKPLVYATFISLLGWFSECLAFYFVFKSFSIDTSMLNTNVLVMSFIYAFSTLVGSISFLPGGLGLTEVSLVGLLVWKGITEVFSVAITFVARAATLWFAVVLGSITLLIYQRKIHLGINEIENIEELKNDKL